jgi:hypothetical protein
MSDFSINSNEAIETREREESGHLQERRRGLARRKVFFVVRAVITKRCSGVEASRFVLFASGKMMGKTTMMQMKFVAAQMES